MKTNPPISGQSATLASTALALACLCFASAVSRAEEMPEAPPEKPNVEQLDANRFRVGDVTFDKKTREIRLPAIVNLKEGILEFLVVHEHGAIHESLFRTHVSPTHINVALKLLDYKASKELYRIPQANGALSDKFHEVPDATKRAARLAIRVEFEKDGVPQRLPVNDWVRHETTEKAMPPSHWVYGGSDFFKGHFIPESSGEIAAIFITDTALINFPGKDNANDEVWTVMTEQVPALETKVTLVLAPYKQP